MQTVIGKSGKVVCVVGCMPIWVLIFDFPKQVLNNAHLGVILFQTWHLSLSSNDR